MHGRYKKDSENNMMYKLWYADELKVAYLEENYKECVNVIKDKLIPSNFELELIENYSNEEYLISIFSDKEIRNKLKKIKLTYRNDFIFDSKFMKLKNIKYLTFESCSFYEPELFISIFEQFRELKSLIIKNVKIYEYNENSNNFDGFNLFH